VIIEGPTCLSRAVLGIEGVGGEERRRARAVLDTLAVSRPDAFVVGQADLEVLPLKELAARAKALGIRLIASNLAPEAASGFSDRLVIDRGGRRTVILGLIGAARNADQAASVPLVDAPGAVARILSDEGDKGRVDLVIVVTDAEKRELRKWQEASLDADVWFVPPGLRRDARYTRETNRLVVRASALGRAFRRLDVAFSGPPGRGLTPADEFPLIEVAKAERVHIQQALQRDGVAPVGDEGVGELQRALADAKYRRGRALERASAPTSGHRVAVTDLLIHPDLIESPEVRRILAAYNDERLGSLAATVGSEREVPRGRVFEGMDACTECHPAEFAQWGRSGHAAAWRTLTEAGQTRNPDCLGCHTTGFAEPGGWVDPEQGRHLFNVQCEACHGPMDLHVAQTSRLGFRSDPGISVVERVCVGCHDPANSPEFDFDAYSRRVAHSPAPEDR
jgi:hypothetical protein